MVFIATLIGITVYLVTSHQVSKAFGFWVGYILVPIVIVGAIIGRQ